MNPPPVLNCLSDDLLCWCFDSPALSLLLLFFDVVECFPPFLIIVLVTVLVFVLLLDVILLFFSPFSEGFTIVNANISSSSRRNTFPGSDARFKIRRKRRNEVTVVEVEDNDGDVDDVKDNDDVDDDDDDAHALKGSLHLLSYRLLAPEDSISSRLTNVNATSLRFIVSWKTSTCEIGLFLIGYRQ